MFNFENLKYVNKLGERKKKLEHLKVVISDRKKKNSSTR